MRYLPLLNLKSTYTRLITLYSKIALYPRNQNLCILPDEPYKSQHALLVYMRLPVKDHRLVHKWTQSLVRRVERCIQFRNILKILGYEDTQVPPHFWPLCYPKQQHFFSHDPSPFCQPGCTNSPTANRDGTTKNHVQCLTLSCYPNSFQIQKLTLSCKTFLAIDRTWYCPWFLWTAGWGRRM